ncbi:hypothetical protein LJC36_01020 [Desulfovibrio sp. OttesenSCG-928-C14]|nr:hypothetical protein [Desulfovibrio sp. OttesenSCG-928-C14]
MKLTRLLLLMVAACLLAQTGCLRETTRQPQVIEIHPTHLKLTLVIGQTTKAQVTSVIGSPHASQIGKDSAFWIYNFSTLYYGGQQNVVLDIAATAKDGFTYNYRWDLRVYGMMHGITLRFIGNILTDFTLT